MPKRRFGKPIRREEAGFGQATERPQQAGQLVRPRTGLCFGSAWKGSARLGQLLHPAVLEVLEGFC